MKRMDASDFSLTNGAAYFVEQSDFAKFREVVKAPKKEVFLRFAVPPKHETDGIVAGNHMS